MARDDSVRQVVALSEIVKLRIGSEGGIRWVKAGRGWVY